MKAIALYGRDSWMPTATHNAGERWTARAEDYYQAACALAGLMGFEVEDGDRLSSSRAQ